MSTRRIAVMGLVTLFLASLSLPAHAEKGGMQIRFGAVYSSPTGDRSQGGQKTELDSAVGFHASFEYMVTEGIGIEPGIFATKHDVDVDQAGFPELDLGEIDLFALAASVNFHVAQTDRVDFYVGPTVGYASWGDLETDVFSQDFPTEDKFLYGLNLGVDLGFGDSPWSFAAAVNYLVTEVGFEDGGDSIDVDPVQVKVGVGYRF